MIGLKTQTYFRLSLVLPEIRLRFQANHRLRRQSCEPIKTQSKYMYRAGIERKVRENVCERATTGFCILLVGGQSDASCFFFPSQSLSVVLLNESKGPNLYEGRMIRMRRMTCLRRVIRLSKMDTSFRYRSSG